MLELLPILVVILVFALVLFLKRVQVVVKHQQATDARAAAAVARASAAIHRCRGKRAEIQPAGQTRPGAARGERVAPGRGWQGSGR